MSIKLRMKSFFKGLLKVSAALIAVGVVLAITNSFAAGDFTAGLKLSGIETNIGTTVANLSKILSNIALVSGIGFVLAALFKFHQHKQNPTQVPISQGITLLLVGCGLTLFPIMIPTARNAVAGTTASISTIKASGIGSLIGASS